jgi:hypothetical protein
VRLTRLTRPGIASDPGKDNPGADQGIALGR